MGADLFSIFFDDKNAPKKTQEEKVVETETTSTKSATYFPDTQTPSPSYGQQPQSAPTPNYSQATQPTTFPTNNIGNLNCEPHMSNVLKQYEQGFEGLNLPGYDFFEFFKAVSQAGIDNPMVYDMAFNMGKSMEPSLTKDKLRSDGQFYLDKINEVYVSFNSEGENSKNSILQDKVLESGNLQNEIELKIAEIEAAKIELANKQQSLRELDNKYIPLLTEVDCKILANNTAKDKMVGLISKVMNNIK